MSALNTIILNGTEYTISGSGSGLTEDVKQALLQITEKVAYIDDDGQDYYNALEEALYPPADLVSISAVYTQSGVVYDTDSLNSLKNNLVVTAHMSDSTTRSVTAYVLSGTLTVGTSTITVLYGGKTDTFTVSVTHYDASIYSWDFTQSLVDSKQNVEAVLGTGASRSSNGLTFSNTDTAQLVDVSSYPQVTIEADVTSFLAANRSDIPASVFGFGQDSSVGGNIGAVFEENKWRFKSHSGYMDDSKITYVTGYDDVTYFNGKTMKLQWDTINGIGKLYADGVLVVQTSELPTGWNYRGMLCAGVSTQGCTITGLRVYEGLV